MTRLQFNISATSLNAYYESQLTFYYDYIEKAEGDTWTPVCYGDAGKIVHSALELYIEEPGLEYRNQIDMFFITQWKDEDLDIKEGVNHSPPLKRDIYHNALIRGCKIIDELETKYTLHVEEKFEYNLIDTDVAIVNCKGFIDIYYKDEKGEYHIIDWKTSSSIDSGDAFERQACIYAHAIWENHKKVPKTATFEYIKINKSKTFYFYEKGEIVPKGMYGVPAQTIKDWKKRMHELAHEIVEKGTNKRLYEIGTTSSPFNKHKKKCSLEQRERLYGGNCITLRLRKNRLYYDSISPKLEYMLHQHFSYNKKDFSPKSNTYIYTPVSLVRNNSIPYTFVEETKKIVQMYNKKYNKEMTIVIDDERNQKIVQRRFNTKFKKPRYDPRYYQQEAHDMVLRAHRGIVYIATGGGKTKIMDMLFRTLNCMSLYVINNLTLLDQVADNLEESLGVPIGRMKEGQLDANKQICCVCIDTISAILKRNNEESQILKKYLANVVCVVYDECQRTRDAGRYQELQENLINVDYTVGLSGSPFRNDGADVAMYALTGAVIYEKTYPELVKEGFIVPVHCYFINNTSNCRIINTHIVKGKEVEYKSASVMQRKTYAKAVIHNDDRLQTLVDVVAYLRKQGQKILILGNSLEHIDAIHKAIGGICITGSKTGQIRAKDFEKFTSGEEDILIGQYKIFCAGIDIPMLNTVINATGVRTPSDVIQMPGRVARLFKFVNAIEGVKIKESVLREFKATEERRMSFMEEVLTTRMGQYDSIIQGTVSKIVSDNASQQDKVFDRFQQIIESITRQNLDLIRYVSSDVQQKIYKNIDDIRKTPVLEKEAEKDVVEEKVQEQQVPKSAPNPTQETKKVESIEEKNKRLDSMKREYEQSGDIQKPKKETVHQGEISEKLKQYQFNTPEEIDSKNQEVYNSPMYKNMDDEDTKTINPSDYDDL